MLDPEPTDHPAIARALAYATDCARLAAALEVAERERDQLRAIVQVIDATAPLADATCDEPGITLSEAVRRTLRDSEHPLFAPPPAGE